MPPWSPLHLASARGHLDVAELLVQRGASIDVFDDKQEIPSYMIVKNGKVTIAVSLSTAERICILWIAKAGPSCTLASYSGRLEVVKLSLRRSADVDVLKKANKTAAEVELENDKAGVCEVHLRLQSSRKYSKTEYSRTC